ncbi:MAG: NnrS family protein [bacterium]|nr:NnrS family protein [bacterium]
MSLPPAPALAVEELAPSSSEPFGLWGRAFRPFFLVLGLHASIAILWWVVAWTGGAPTPAWLAPMWWHGHEMVFGLAAAAIAGFLLTASPVWTGGPALTGRPLAALLALWVAGRVVFAVATVLPAWLVALVDFAFLPAVAVAALRTIWGSGQVRNYGVVGIVVVLAGANGAVHADALGVAPGLARTALRFAVDLLVILILEIGGRITPAFTQNALRQRGRTVVVRSWLWLNRLAIASAVATAVSASILGRSSPTGILGVIAGLSALARMAGWQSWQTRSDPLLWSLHAGSLWVVVGLLLAGASDLGVSIPSTVGLHALTVGAIGGTIIAVMTRVGIGHTGRPLVLPEGVVWCYVLVHLAALTRVAAPFVSGVEHRAVLLASALAWTCAFGLFTVRYWSILTMPRPDGRPG